MGELKTVSFRFAMEDALESSRCVGLEAPEKEKDGMSYSTLC